MPTNNLNALGVTKITYSFETKKWSITIDNPKAGLESVDRYGWRTTTYPKSRTFSGISLDRLTRKVAEEIAEAASLREEKLRRNADAARAAADAAAKHLEEQTALLTAAEAALRDVDTILADGLSPVLTELLPLLTDEQSPATESEE